MDTDFVEQLICSDCGLVHSEIAVLGAHVADKTCPGCGAGVGAVLSVECVYGTAQASLMRL